MNHSFRYLAIFIAIALNGVSYGAAFTYTEKTENMSAHINFVDDAFSVGVNKLVIKVMDSNGAAITDASVKVKFKMKPMGGMMPMSMSTTATLSDDGYQADLDFAMVGSWDIEVKIKRADKQKLKTKFSIKVR